jgi:hypothetical protein
MDADVYGPSVPLMLGIDEKAKPDEQKRLVPIERHGIKVMSMGFFVDDTTPIIWRGPMLTKLITEFLRNCDWGALDTLVMDLPPPPPPAGLPPPMAAPDLADAPDDPDPRAHRSGLSAAWRWTLGLGWCVVMAGIGALAQSAFLVDADPFWFSFKPLPFAVPVAALLALARDGRWSLPFSGLAAAVLVVVAIVDAAQSNPVVAIGEGVCAAGGALLTMGALLGRDRPPPHDAPRSAE